MKAKSAPRLASSVGVEISHVRSQYGRHAWGKVVIRRVRDTVSGPKKKRMAIPADAQIVKREDPTRVVVLRSASSESGRRSSRTSRGRPTVISRGLIMRWRLSAPMRTTGPTSPPFCGRHGWRRCLRLPRPLQCTSYCSRLAEAGHRRSPR